MKVLVEIDMPERDTLTVSAIAVQLRQIIASGVDLTDKRVGANEGKLMSPNGHSIGTWAVREAPAVSGAAALASAEIRHGFLTMGEVEAIAADPETRLKPLLVRCGSGRFIASAQYVAHYIAIIERDAAAHVDEGISDYVRDISLPVGPHYVVPSTRNEFAYAGLRSDRYRVTAIFTGDEDANRHLATHPGEGVIATLGQFVIVAEHKAVKGEDPVLVALRAAWDMLRHTEVRYFIRDGEGDHLGEAAQYDNALKLARAAGLL